MIRTLAVAMMTLLVTQTAMAQTVTEEDAVWARHGDLALEARLYRPAEAETPLPVMIDVHGGAWSAGGRADGALYDRALAEAGFLVVAIDFRQGAEHPHPAASADVAAAVRWVRLNAVALGADPERIGLIGSSSGGHLAMLAALRPGAPAHLGTPITLIGAGGPDGEAAPRDEIDASVAYVAALWPVSDPLARYRYAVRARIEPLQRGHEAYFGGDEAAMLDASIPRIVTSGEAGSGADLPALLVVQPGMDSNVPQEITLDLIRAWQSRDGHLEYAFYPDQPHAFGVRPSAETDDMIRLIAHFARRHSAR